MSVVIETTLGDITVDLYLDQRPVTCLNFLKLCKMKYYNFNLFHSIRSGFIAQTGDPTAEGSSGESIFGLLEGPEKRFFSGEKLPKIRHTNTGTLSMVCTGDMMVGSQFFFTLAPDLDSLDGVHCVIGEVTEGHDVLRKLNDVICDESHRPYRDVRITHTVVLEDPFNDPPGFRTPSRSPSPTTERLKGGRIAPDEDIDETQGKSAEEIQEIIEEKEAKARATILEIVGDLPDADIAPPENVLFVCKLNPVTTDEDLEIIFSRFGKIVGCEVIRDKKTGDSLQYAFIEFADKKSCEEAYFKMDNVLIDDRRIHVDFSQSVSRMRWLGKGRGIKYFNSDDSKDRNVHNHSFDQPHNKDSEQKDQDNRNGRLNDDDRKRHENKDREYQRDKSNRDRRSERSEKDRSKRERSRPRGENNRSKRERSRSKARVEKHREESSRHTKEENKSVSRKEKSISHQERSSSKSKTEKSKDTPSRHHKDKSVSSSRLDSELARNHKGRSRSRSKLGTSHEDSSRNHKEKSNNTSRTLKNQADSIRSERDKNVSHSKTERYKHESSSNKKGRSRSKSNEKSHKSYDRNHSKDGTDSKRADKSHDKNHSKDDTDSKRADKSIKSNSEKLSPDHGTEQRKQKSDKHKRDRSPVGNKKRSNKEHKHIDAEKATQQDSKEDLKFKDKDTRTPTPVIDKKVVTKKNDKKKKVTDKISKKKRKQSTSSSDSSSDSSTSSDSSSSSEEDRKKKSLKRRKKKVSTSSSSSSSSSSDSSSSTDSSTTSSSSDSEPTRKKRKKNANIKVDKIKKSKKKL